MSQLKIGNKNTILVPACQVQPGNILVGKEGNTVKVTDVLDLDEQVIIYTDEFAFNVDKNRSARVQRAA